jgi:hypothetical protein
LTEINESIPFTDIQIREEEKQLIEEGEDKSEISTLSTSTLPEDETRIRGEFLFFSSSE